MVKAAMSPRPEGIDRKKDMAIIAECGRVGLPKLRCYVDEPIYSESDGDGIGGPRDNASVFEVCEKISSSPRNPVHNKWNGNGRAAHQKRIVEAASRDCVHPPRLTGDAS